MDWFEILEIGFSDHFILWVLAPHCNYLSLVQKHFPLFDFMFWNTFSVKSLISLHDLRSRNTVSTADSWMIDSFELGSIGKVFLTFCEGLFGTQVFHPSLQNYHLTNAFALKAIYFPASLALKVSLAPHISQLPFSSKCLNFSLVYSRR